MIDSGAGSPPGAEDFKVTRWLQPIGLLSNGGLESKAVVYQDPDDATHASRDRNNLTDILIPPDTPVGSLIVTTSPYAHEEKTPEGTKYVTEPRIQFFMVVAQKDGPNVLEAYPLHEDALGLKPIIARELPVGNDKQAMTARSETRLLKPDYAHEDQLILPKIKPSDSLCQRLPSQSPNINLALITQADLKAFKQRQTKNMSRSRKETQPQPHRSHTPLSFTPIPQKI